MQTPASACSSAEGERVEMGNPAWLQGKTALLQSHSTADFRSGKTYSPKFCFNESISILKLNMLKVCLTCVAMSSREPRVDNIQPISGANVVAKARGQVKHTEVSCTPAQRHAQKRCDPANMGPPTPSAFKTPLASSFQGHLSHGNLHKGV